MINKNEVKSILLAGVGGQGILKASDIMCEALMAAGCDVKKSEVHGMAQRGGCVTSHVRFGKKVYSPLAKPESVDILISFEKMETLRYLHYLKKDATIIINTEKIYPPAVNIGDLPYPCNIVNQIQKNHDRIKEIDAAGLARAAGNIKATNTVLLGAAAKLISIKSDIWIDVIKKSFPTKLINLNLDAFQMGIDA
ncbi:MAG TPA: indolepyruvate oxidoreductase subunit beta [Deltaproteobacteria bacterium]|nr:indolepyruvate oxidoreductase subunit beta [Deltaproteobacteria bacterium]